MINTPASLRSDHWMLCVGIGVCFQSESVSGFVGIRNHRRQSFLFHTSATPFGKTNRSEQRSLLWSVRWVGSFSFKAHSVIYSVMQLLFATQVHRLSAQMRVRGEIGSVLT